MAQASNDPADPREPYREQFENMLWSLFAPQQSPLFDKSEIPPALLDEFLQSDEAFAAARAFALQLHAIWKVQHPGTPLRLNTPAAPEPLATTIPSPEAALSTTPEETPEPPARSAPIDLRRRPGSTPPAGAQQRAPVARSASFQAANAKAGQAYAGKIERVGAHDTPTQLRDVRLPAGLDLSFTPAGAALLGTPTQAGDHEIGFEWSDDGQTWSAGKCILIVNPDPRSLWQVNEPAADLSYRKPHLDCQLITAPACRLAAASRRGRSHEHSGSFRDDDFFIHHDAASGWDVMIVADGAGSAPSSRWGSRLAAEAAGAHLVATLAGALGADMARLLGDWDADPAGAAKNVGEKFHYLFHDAGSLAVDAIEAEASAQGVPAKDYATTLLACAVRKQGADTFLASFWMGDGAIAAYGTRGKVRLMGAPDGGEFAGQTRFLDRAALADSSFAKRIGIGRYPELTAVILMTDGISDPRFETDNGLADAGKWDALWDDIAPCLAAQQPDQQLLAWLAFFTPGHHDDRTIAVRW
jgi:hypothetical protein